MEGRKEERRVEGGAGRVVGGWWCLFSVLFCFLGGAFFLFLAVFGVVFWYNGFGCFFGYLPLCGK